MFSSVSCFKIGFLIIPFEEFRVVCSVTSTGTPKKRSFFSGSLFELSLMFQLTKFGFSTF